ncbi:Sugar transporter, conserved site,Major facilitator superfamily domain,Major facilitator, sugar [Cinara cedri]|uniref:Sugar transporter, conserved site,Major facilitator superfamily domain,Major facilitator, sugar n=1 Tax=Cinara cedri TaxID=506608 RepID=A0A5E4MI48_9HEMI|nr:Sugar transporter, conserved site,Major facilitator superfamily domain,Major facilitator, sugar [Cinara cedri]
MVTDGGSGTCTFSTPLLFENNYSSFASQHRTAAISHGIQYQSNGIVINRDEEYNTANKRLSWTHLSPQILVSIVAFMLVTQPGINMVYSSIFMNHYEFTDVSELSWLTGILVLSTSIGAITIGVIMDLIGRKNALLLTCAMLLISWLIASVDGHESMSLFYACRFFAGIGGGMTIGSVIYVSEIAHASYKQVLLSLNSVFFSVGVLFATALGSLFPWHVVNITFLIYTAVTMALLVVFLPESPVWLIRFGTVRAHEARCSLKRIYPRNDQVFAEEWDRIMHVWRQPAPCYRPPITVQDCTLTSFRVVNPSTHDRGKRRGRVRWWWWCWCTPQPTSVTRPATVLAVVFLLQQLSGCYPALFYSVPVFRSVVGCTDTKTGPSQMDTLIAFGVLRLLTSVVACTLSPHIGRRRLLIASALVMACSAALVAATCSPTASPLQLQFQYDDDPTKTPVSLPLLPLVGIVAFACGSSAGVLVFPWTLVGELLPVTSRAVVGAALVSFAYVLMFVVLLAFPYFIAVDVGGGGGSVAVAFTVFAAVSLTMAVYVYVRLPETLGKQCDEIERQFTDP